MVARRTSRRYQLLPPIQECYVPDNTGHPWTPQATTWNKRSSSISGYGFRAWSQLASDLWIQTTQNGWLDPTEGYERVRQLAQHALQLSPELAEAHAALMFVHRTLDWDWAAAESEAGSAALAIDPTNPDALDVAGALFIRLAVGTTRNDNSARRLSVIHSTPFVLTDLAITYYFAGRLAESEDMYRKVL